MSKSNNKRRILVVEYDVTGLTGKQIDHLMLEAVVQGEASDGHPDVPILGPKIVERARKA